MTQHQLILAYILEHGSILPSHMGGKAYKDGFFGSETSKRCRELRAKGVLRSEPDKEHPKFERFFLGEIIGHWHDSKIKYDLSKIPHSFTNLQAKMQQKLL